MDRPKGGRGKKAPYVSTHARVPEPTKPYIEVIVQMFHDGTLPPIEEFKQLVEAGKENTLPTLEGLTLFAKNTLKRKMSARKSLEHFLSGLYPDRINDIDLE